MLQLDGVPCSLCQGLLPRPTWRRSSTWRRAAAATLRTSADCRVRSQSRRLMRSVEIGQEKRRLAGERRSTVVVIGVRDCMMFAVGDGNGDCWTRRRRRRCGGWPLQRCERSAMKWNWRTAWYAWSGLSLQLDLAVSDCRSRRRSRTWIGSRSKSRRRGSHCTRRSRPMTPRYQRRRSQPREV